MNEHSHLRPDGTTFPPVTPDPPNPPGYTPPPEIELALDEPEPEEDEVVGSAPPAAEVPD